MANHCSRELMMNLEEIYKKLDAISPFQLQEKWDNSGLIVGDLSQEISTVVVSLDIDAELIEASDEGVLFIVHHPLIFSGITALDFSKYPSNLLREMIRKNQSCIAMHTNFDKTHLNRYVFEKVLGFENSVCEDFLCTATGEWSLEALTTHIKEKLQLPVVKIVAPKEKIYSISLTTGAGASLLDSVTSDCFLTGDIKYHDAMKAKSQNLMMIEVGHYESEQFFAEILADELKLLPLLAIITNSKNPFQI